ncbi:MAG: hypothetical protein ACTS2F_11240 [Thainema sp.]
MTENNSHTLSSPQFQPLSVTPPAQFESALGIRTSARWLGLYWEPQLNQVCYTDGDTVSTGNAHAWQLFCAHPQIQPLLAPYQLGDYDHSAQHALLLDRQNHRFYIGESALVEDYLKHPETLNLLAQLDAPTDAPVDLPYRLRERLWNFRLPNIKNRWLLFLIGVPVVAIAVILLHEVGDFIFDLLEFLDD